MLVFFVVIKRLLRLHLRHLLGFSFQKDLEGKQSCLSLRPADEIIEAEVLGKVILVCLKKVLVVMKKHCYLCTPLRN